MRTLLMLAPLSILFGGIATVAILGREERLHVREGSMLGFGLNLFLELIAFFTLYKHGSDLVWYKHNARKCYGMLLIPIGLYIGLYHLVHWSIYFVVTLCGIKITQMLIFTWFVPQNSMVILFAN